MVELPEEGQVWESSGFSKLSGHGHFVLVIRVDMKRVREVHIRVFYSNGEFLDLWNFLDEFGNRVRDLRRLSEEEAAVFHVLRA